MIEPLKFDRQLVQQLRDSLTEDLGAGDVTTESIVPARMPGEGKLYAKADGIFCGAVVAEQVWHLVSRKVRLHWRILDGKRVHPGQILLELSGPYRALLIGERVALNFMQRLSGIATLTDKIVKAAGGRGSPAICDTRKTTPLWRKLERYAVRAGGGVNHRFGLFDMVLIKENHVRAAGSIAKAIKLARFANPKLQIAAEARNKDEVQDAFNERPNLILLDNMTPTQIKRIVRDFGGRGISLEISGGVNLKTVAAYSKTGADRISIGALTHSAPALDLSLQLYPKA